MGLLCLQVTQKLPRFFDDDCAHKRGRGDGRARSVEKFEGKRRVVLTTE